MAKKTTDKGLGWRHQQAADDLKKKHKDGSPCEWCGRPMWLEPTKNWDFNPDPEAKVRGNGVLQADHEIPRSVALRRGEKPLPPDRLLHAECNRQRGAGGNDHLSANNRQAVATGNLAMPWPWKS